MGDGAMIVFGLPAATADDPTNALALRRHARHPVPRLARRAAGDGRARGIGIKLGAHCGPIVASRLGGGSQQTITATGDASTSPAG